jgi:preprotein translocase subunit SecF
MSGFARLMAGTSEIDFLGRRRLWFAISGVAILISVVAIFLRPTDNPCAGVLPDGLNCGIEFNGGLTISSPIPADGPLGDSADLDVISELEAALDPVGAGDAQVQVASQDGGRTIQVQTRDVSEEQRARIVGTVGETVGAEPGQIASESISASFGGEITEAGLRALIVFLVVIMLFISWRFEWKMGVAAIAALFHDLIITAGVYALVGFEVTPSTVIALLTILGYSLYDTVVVFDKVEEDTAMYATTGRMTYSDAANMAMNEVFMRSLNTSLATLLPVAALLFVGAGLFGASTLEDLALALFVGILMGAYSSICFATPLLATLKEREPKYRNVRQEVLRRSRSRDTQDEERVVMPVTGRPERAESTAGGGTSRPQSPPRSRAGSKKAKRRRRR